MVARDFSAQTVLVNNLSVSVGASMGTALRFMKDFRLRLADSSISRSQ